MVTRHIWQIGRLRERLEANHNWDHLSDEQKGELLQETIQREWSQLPFQDQVTVQVTYLGVTDSDGHEMIEVAIDNPRLKG